MSILKKFISCFLSAILIISNLSIICVAEDISAKATSSSNLTVYSIDANSTIIYGRALPSDEVTAKVSSKQIGWSKADANGSFTMKIPKQKAFTRITITTKTVSGYSYSKTIRVKFTIDSIVKSTSTKISGKGPIGGTAKAYVNGTKIGSVTVNSYGNYTINIKSQKKDTIITVKMTDKSGLSMQRNTTVVSFKNPSLLVKSGDSYKIDVPTSNKNLIIDNSIKTAISFIPKFSSEVELAYVAISNLNKTEITQTDITQAKRAVENIIDYTRNKVSDKALESYFGKSISDRLSITSSMISTVIEVDKLYSNLEADTTDYKLNILYKKLIANDVTSEQSAMAIVKFNYAMTVLKDLRCDGYIKIDSNNNITTTTKGKAKLKILKSDLYKIEVESMKKKYDSDFTIDPIVYNDTKITGYAPRKDIKVYACVDGKCIGYATASKTLHKFTIDIPKQPVGKKIELIGVGKITFDKTYKYYSHTVNTTVGKAPIKYLSINKIYNTNTSISGKSLAYSTVTAYAKNSSGGYIKIGSSTCDKNGNYKISIVKQKIGTNIQVKANKKNYATNIKYATVYGKISTYNVDEIHEGTVKITGKTIPNARVKAYVDGARPNTKNSIGETISSSSTGKFSIPISKKSIGTKIYIEISKKNYESKVITKYVIKNNTIPTTGSWKTSGDFYITDDNKLAMTYPFTDKNQFYEVGNAVYDGYVPEEFEATFKYSIKSAPLHGNYTDSFGFVFMFKNDIGNLPISYIDNRPIRDSSMGFSPNGYGVEFDLNSPYVKNSPFNDKHVALIKDSTNNHVKNKAGNVIGSTTSKIFNYKGCSCTDYEEHLCKIKVKNNHLTVYIDGENLVDQDVTFEKGANKIGFSSCLILTLELYIDLDSFTLKEL